MKAVAVFPARRQVQLIDHPEPSIQSSTQVKLRVLDVGVCGTDREITSFQYGTPPDGSDYLIIGHESLTEVIGAGEKATIAGQRQVCEPSSSSSSMSAKRRG